MFGLITLLKNKLFQYGLLALGVFVGSVLVWSAMSDIFSFETKDKLKAKLIEANASIKSAIDINTALVTDLHKATLSNDVTQANMSILLANREEINKNYQSKRHQHHQRAPTNDSIVESNAQLDYIWIAWCSYNNDPTDVEAVALCKDIKK